ncbi:PilW family protein [Aquincola sp. MAHUQ-54]|uniref:PilW family protein n=1 Tax=Aquincola agrisoli TaxID=3119538 RepID=A0AAW9QH38_9BURK
MCASDPRRRQRGLSIVELMIGIVISLLVGLAASNSALVFSAMQRQGLSAGSAVVSATTTLSALKEDAAQAGLGFFGNGQYLCNALNLRVGTTDHSQAQFSPLRVTRNNGQDQIDIFYATNVAGGANVALQTPSALNWAELRSYLPVDAGQAVLLAPEAPGVPCTVRTVTAQASSTETTPQRLTFDAAGAHNQGAAFASPALLPIGSRVSLLGSIEWHRYAVVDGNLQLQRPMETGANANAVLVRNVVALRAQLGVMATANGPTTVDAWVPPTTKAPSGADWGNLAAADIGQARAIRITLLTRSPQPEKPEPRGCTATPTAPRIWGEEITPSNVGSTPWQCYRYRTSEVVVPLRNWIMGL